MTHTSTEQPEALRLAGILEKEAPYYGITEGASYELRRLHARVQELEAAQARAPLSDFIETLAQSWDGCMYDAPGEDIDIGASIRRAAITSGITQEKQG